MILLEARPDFSPGLHRLLLVLDGDQAVILVLVLGVVCMVSALFLYKFGLGVLDGAHLVFLAKRGLPLRADNRQLVTLFPVVLINFVWSLFPGLSHRLKVRLRLKFIEIKRRHLQIPFQVHLVDVGAGRRFLSLPEVWNLDFAVLDAGLDGYL